MSAVEKFASMFESDGTDRYSRSLDELIPLQIQAIEERLAEQRSGIPVLGHRIEEQKVGSITTLADAVPLLFSHTVYKSYPESFLAKGQWDKMSRWVSTLSMSNLDDIDMSGVVDIDDWVGKLWSSRHYITTSSGTGGKFSVLDLRTEFERDGAVNDSIKLITAVAGVKPRADRPVFLLGPSRGLPRMVHYLHRFGEAFGRPDATYWLSHEPLTFADLAELVNLARALADGTASPSDIAKSEERARATQERTERELDELCDAILKHREDPSVFMGPTFLFWMVMENLRKRGVDRIDCHPETTLLNVGGVKQAQLPPDYQEQIAAFFDADASHAIRGYSQTEITGAVFPRCSEGLYHCPPWVALFILDESGERFLNQPAGQVNGRVAVFDTMAESHWGGIISGDNVDADFSPCACGRPAPTVTNIKRYSEIQGGDDKLSCAGSLDAYVRGIVD